MINVSDEYKKAILKNRAIYADVEITTAAGIKIEVEQKHIRSLVLNDDVSNNTSFDIGSAIINQCTLKVDNTGGEYNEAEFDQAEIVVKIGLQLSETVEWINKGVFVAEPGEITGDVITIKAYDNMLKFDLEYSNSNLIYPATLGQIVRDACDVCGVALGTASFEQDDYIVRERPDSETLTFREVLTWVGQIACCWFRCDTYGALTADFYDLLSYENEQNMHEINVITAFSKSTEDIVITGIKVSQEDTVYMHGSEGYVLAIEDNGLIQGQDGQTVAALLGEKLVGLRFRKLSVTHQSDPSIEAGDLAKITDWKGTVYKTLLTSVTFSFGGHQKSACNAETPVRKRAKRFSASTKTQISLRKQIKAEQIARELAVEKLQKKLADSSGLYASEEKQEDGSTIYYLHDKSTMGESVAVIKLTAEAIGFSRDGGETYPYGFSLTGEMITRMLQTEGVNADWINAGEFTVKDADGNIVFSANIDTGSVILSADSVMIGDRTIKQALKDVEASAKNMSIQMSNEYQAIPVDAEGNCADFPECRTVIMVMYGSADISSECTYTVTKSEAVTGNWNKSALTYIVSDLAADDGWVDIKATYAGTLSVTKRFVISKVYAGEDGKEGAAGRTFILEPSASLIKREEGDILNPGYLEFHSYYRDGAGTARNTYAGRFLIEETYDGNTWKTVYQSDVDESSVRHSLYSFIVDAEGNPIMTEDGYGIASDRAVQEVRCYIYAAGGFTNLLDRQNIPIVYDMAALTQDKVFDILTNGGEAKGIYKEGNQLYISFTYARGGNLDLGGLNNGNGLLRILDASGKQVGYIDNTGVNFEKGNIRGVKIIGSEIYTSSHTGQVNMQNANLDFFDYGADEEFQHAGSIYPTTGEIWVSYPQDDGSVMLMDAVASGIQIDTNYWFNVTLGGFDALTCMAGSYYAGQGVTEGTSVSVDVLYATEVQTSGGIETESISASGTKSRVVKDTNYGDRLLYCQESPTPYFSDIGVGMINEDGECIVTIDDIFSETIDCNGDYSVFLQKEGPGDLWIDEKDFAYFVVKGTPGLAFSWEMKAAQKGYENYRLEEKDLKVFTPDEGQDISNIFINEINKDDEEMEVYLLESIESISD